MKAAAAPAAFLPQPVGSGFTLLSNQIAGVLGSSFAVLCIGLVSSMVLNRALGPAVKGSYATILTTAQLVVLVASLGLAKSVTFQLAEAGADRRLLFRSIITAVCGALSVSLLLTLLVAMLWPAPSLRGVLTGSAGALAALAALNVATGCGVGVLRGLKRFRESNLYQPLANIGALFLLIGMCALGSVSLGTALACKIGGGLILLALLVRMLVREGFSFRPARNHAHLRGIFGYGIGYFGYALFHNLNYRFDILMVSSLAGSAATGWYSTATGLAEIIWYLPNAIGVVLFPVAVGLAERDSDDLIARVCRWSVHAMLIATAILAAVAPTAITLLYGDAFAPSAEAIRALAIGVVTNSFFQVLGVRLAARKQLRALTCITMAGFAVNVAGNLVLIPRFGFVGAAWASTVSYTVTGLLTAVHFTRHSTVSWRELLFIPRSEAVALAQRLFRLLRKSSP